MVLRRKRAAIKCFHFEICKSNTSAAKILINIYAVCLYIILRVHECACEAVYKCTCVRTEALLFGRQHNLGYHSKCSKSQIWRI